MEDLHFILTNELNKSLLNVNVFSILDGHGGL